MDNAVDRFVREGNALLEKVMKNGEERPVAEDFFRSMLRQCFEKPASASQPPDYWKAVQLIGQQGLNILSWGHHSFPQATALRLTADPREMLSAEGRGPSFIDKGTLPGVPASQEGRSGPYWRGVEGMAKVKGSLIPELLDQKEDSFDWVVLYTMVHGMVAVPETLTHWTEEGSISTFHDTAFVWDRVPGTRQAASTGAGHFQGRQLDLKQAVEGRGIQFNVMYGPDGAIDHVHAQELKPNSWTLALPGHVDYVVNAGGLRFHDISFRLSPDQSRIFGNGVKPAALLRAPVALSVDGSIHSASASNPSIVWVKDADIALDHFPEDGLLDLYSHLTKPSAAKLIQPLLERLKE